MEQYSEPIATFKYAVFDGGLFRSHIPEELFTQYPADSYYAAPSFLSEVEQYSQILPEDEKDILSWNYRTLNDHGLRIYDPGDHTIHDTYSLLEDLSKEQGDGENGVLYISQNFSMVRRVIYSGLNVDVFYVHGNIFYWKESFPEIRATMDYGPRTETAGENLTLEDEMILYTQEGEPVTLKYSHKSGREARLYFCEEYEDLIAKVFLQEISTEKEKNIRALEGIRRLISLQWVPLPVKLLYADPQCSRLRGFMQKYIRNTRTMICPDYGCLDDSLMTPEFGPKDTLKWCIMIARQVAILSNYNVLVCDYNQGNFGVDLGQDEYLYMWDADSFVTLAYPPNYMAVDIGRSRPYDLRHVPDTIRMCTEFLYSFVFKSLSMNCCPVHMNHDEVILQEHLDRGGLNMDIVPPTVMDICKKVFLEGIHPSVDGMLHALTLAANAEEPNEYYSLSYIEADDLYFRKYGEVDPMGTDSESASHFFGETVVDPEDQDLIIEGDGIHPYTDIKLRAPWRRKIEPLSTGQYRSVQPEPFSIGRAQTAVMDPFTKPGMMSATLPTYVVEYPKEHPFGEALLPVVPSVLRKQVNLQEEKYLRRQGRKRRRQQRPVARAVRTALFLFLLVFGWIAYVYWDSVMAVLNRFPFT